MKTTFIYSFIWSFSPEIYLWLNSKSHIWLQEALWHISRFFWLIIIKKENKKTTTIKSVHDQEQLQMTFKGLLQVKCSCPEFLFSLISFVFSFYPAESHRLRWGHMTWSRPCGRPIGHPRSSLSNLINQSIPLNPFCVCVSGLQYVVLCCLHQARVVICSFLYPERKTEVSVSQQAASASPPMHLFWICVRLSPSKWSLLFGKPQSWLVAHCGTLEEQMKNWIAPSHLCLVQIFFTWVGCFVCEPTHSI